MWGAWVLALPPVPHVSGCDRSEPYGETCAACRLQEIEAWDRWYALFRWVPNWRYSGWGRG